MELLKNKKYQALLQEFISYFPDWDNLSGKCLLISGSTGMIGSFLVDAVMTWNNQRLSDKKCRILATSRSHETAKRRFAPWLDMDEFSFFPHDIVEPIDPSSLPELPDYLIHTASTTHPAQYVDEPINTIFANVLGCRNMLELATQKPGSRFLLLSSVEVYGENRGDTDYFDEGYCGYIDCNTLRAGYPEAKRVSESLCHAYMQEKDTTAVILRLPRAYGPTLRMNDTKALSQFLKKGLAGEDIVLKSKGDQFYSYAFVSDAALGMLYALLRGKSGRAYNLADAGSDIRLKDLAALVAKKAGRKVIFELPDERERAGYSTATKALLNADKLKGLGWQANYDLDQGIALTIEILKEGARTDVGTGI